ncbi:MAG: glycerate kinase type-2 family protein [Steroidobacteraceae bacterium]
MTDRELLWHLARVGLAAVDPHLLTLRALAGYRLRGPVDVLAVGKAALTMAEGAVEFLGQRLGEGLIIHPGGDTTPVVDPRFRVLTAAHPVPDASSLRAGAEALEWAAARPAGREVLWLVSGGASSLLEALPEGVPAEALVALNQWALASGHDIRRVNGLRRRLSRVKDGRLLARLAHCQVTALYLSDVPGDDPTVLASGLLGRAAVEDPLPADLPPELATWLEAVDLPQGSPPPTRLACIGSIATAMAAVAEAGTALGLPPPERACLEGPVEGALAALRGCLEGSAAHWIVAGGETTIRLPPHPGRGGRNQHLALLASGWLEERGEGVFLALATDGRDGPGAAAGALVDSATLERGRAAGCDPADSLASASSGTFLASSGDLLVTGPTGTNVGDLVICKITP